MYSTDENDAGPVGGVWRKDLEKDLLGFLELPVRSLHTGKVGCQKRVSFVSVDFHR